MRPLLFKAISAVFWRITGSPPWSKILFPMKIFPPDPDEPGFVLDSTALLSMVRLSATSKNISPAWPDAVVVAAMVIPSLRVTSGAVSVTCPASPCPRVSTETRPCP